MTKASNPKSARKKAIASSSTGAVPAALKKKIDPNAYNNLVKQAQLASISLVKNKFEVVPEYFDGDDRDGSEPKNAFSFDHEWKGTAYHSNNGLVSGVIIWSLSVKQGEKTVLGIQCHYLVIYDNLKDQDSATATFFLERVGHIATYPYFRSLVSQLSWESGANLPLLPVISQQPLPKPAS